jgi:superfamily II DNA/RNA helicase
METHMTTFVDLGLPETLVRVLASQQITAPTPIQAAALPDALAGRDVVGQAPTGSGKTVAFALPLVTSVAKASPRRPRALVLAPTRELASQIAAVIAPLAATRGRTVATFFGGTSVPRDVKRLAAGVDIAVGCPGRLEDLVRRGALNLGGVAFVVVDEADRMADMGFLPTVTRLLDHCATRRQTLLFSATLEGDVNRLVERYQHRPHHHAVAIDTASQAVVDHHFWNVAREHRRETLTQLLHTADSAIVFVRTKHGAERLTKQLNSNGAAAAAIHGNRSQPQRERALAAFRSGAVSTLVATDIAARGIHVDQVQLVVHYDLPAVHADYVHRSGRTGRAGHDGVVVAFVEPAQAKDAASLQRSLKLGSGSHPPDPALLRTTGSRPAARTQGPDSTSRSERRTPTSPRVRAKGGRRR